MEETTPYHQCATAKVYAPTIFCPTGCGQISDIRVEEGKLVLENKQTRERREIQPRLDDRTLDLICAGIIDTQISAIDRSLTGYKTSAAEFLMGVKSGIVNFEKTALRIPATDLYSLLGF